MSTKGLRTPVAVALILAPRPRLRSLVITLVTVFILFFAVKRLGWGIEQVYVSKRHFHLKDVDSDDLTGPVKFWTRFSPILHAHAPSAASPTHPGDSNLDVGFDGKDRPRPDLLLMPHSYVDVMRKAHQGFVSDIQFMHQASEESLNLPYKAGTRGIVSTAGGSYLAVFVISLRMLRRTGSILPVEVFLANLDEYETHICNVVLPTLNAKCLVLSQILDAVPATVEISRYQYKILSILFSSFEDVLFLDSDAFPVRDPDVLFDSEPFNATGLVLWPDFWYPSESPAYFTISAQPVPSLQERQSTESGEILYSKAKRELSLLLATYYNIYGPTHYYPLQSQGAPGEGDKETYGWAAEALGMTAYHVKQPVRALGVFNRESGSFEGSAMVQYDPRDDYIWTTQKNKSVPFGRAKYTNSDPTAAPADPTPFFVHANFPKFNPATIWVDPGPTHHPDGRFRRVWEDDDTVKGFGFDVEKRFWEEIKWTSCELETKFDSWRGIGGICNVATTYWNDVFG